MLEMFGKILPRPWPRQPMQLQRLCVPVQFFQLWTIFLAVVRHTLPAIHCLMTAKSQNLYQAVLENISVNIPLFQPSSTMSDWEPPPRNAFRNVYPQMKVYGCWFHYSAYLDQNSKTRTESRLQKFSRSGYMY